MAKCHARVGDNTFILQCLSGTHTVPTALGAVRHICDSDANLPSGGSQTRQRRGEAGSSDTKSLHPQGNALSWPSHSAPLVNLDRLIKISMPPFSRKYAEGSIMSRGWSLPMPWAASSEGCLGTQMLSSFLGTERCLARQWAPGSGWSFHDPLSAVPTGTQPRPHGSPRKPEQSFPLGRLMTEGSKVVVIAAPALHLGKRLRNHEMMELKVSQLSFPFFFFFLFGTPHTPLLQLRLGR